MLLLAFKNIRTGLRAKTAENRMKKTTDTIRHHALLGIGSSKPSYFEEKCLFHSPRTASNMHLVFVPIPELESRASHMLGKGSTVSMTQACAFVELSTSTLY